MPSKPHYSLMLAAVVATTFITSASGLRARELGFRCEPSVANGVAWARMSDDPASAEYSIFYVDATCKGLDQDGVEYFPTGGGFHYDGAVIDPV